MDGGSEQKLPAVYPFIEFKGWTLPTFQSFSEDAGKQLNNVQSFNSRESDVLMCTSMKSGTHWLYQIVSMLLDHTTEFNTRGTLMDAHIEFYSDFSKFEKETHVRLLHTHLPFNYIPKKHKELGAKVIYLNRNPKDRLLSQYKFFSKLTGYPKNWPWNDYLDEFLRNDTLRGGWFLFTKEYAEALSFETAFIRIAMLCNLWHPLREIKRIAEFVGVDADESFFNVVKENTTFDSLKKNVYDGTVIFSRDSKPHLFRKGVMGEWKEQFTVAQSEELDSMFAKELGDLNVEFIYESPKT